MQLLPWCGEFHGETWHPPGLSDKGPPLLLEHARLGIEHVDLVPTRGEGRAHLQRAEFDTTYRSEGVDIGKDSHRDQPVPAGASATKRRRTLRRRRTTNLPRRYSHGPMAIPRHSARVSWIG